MKRHKKGRATKRAVTRTKKAKKAKSAKQRTEVVFATTNGIRCWRCCPVPHVMGACRCSCHVERTEEATDQFGRPHNVQRPAIVLKKPITVPLRSQAESNAMHAMQREIDFWKLQSQQLQSRVTQLESSPKGYQSGTDALVIAELRTTNAQLESSLRATKQRLVELESYNATLGERVRKAEAVALATPDEMQRQINELEVRIDRLRDEL